MEEEEGEKEEEEEGDRARRWGVMKVEREMERSET